MRPAKVRPDVRAISSAAGADEIWLDIGEPDIVEPEVGVDLDVMAASMIAAIDQHIADAGCAHFAEGDLLRICRHRGQPAAMMPGLALRAANGAKPQIIGAQ